MPRLYVNGKPADLDRAQEDVYELNMRYIKLAHDVRQGQLRSATRWVNDLVFHAGAAATGGSPFQFACDTAVLAADVERPGAGGTPTRVEARAPQLKTVTALPLPGPMDGLAPDGTPWVSDAVLRRSRRGSRLCTPGAQREGSCRAATAALRAPMPADGSRRSSERARPGRTRGLGRPSSSYTS